MIILIVLLSFAVVLQLPTSSVHAAGVGPAEQKQIVDKHNALRRAVQPSASNMLKMTYSSAAEANAKRWAHNCVFQHSSSNQRVADGIQCGENLYTSSHPATWDDVIQAWYDEVKDFQYGVGKVRPGVQVGHYTQVVWYSSYQVGCYDAHCPQNKLPYLYVCQYCPAGNIVGSLEKPYKTGSPCADCPGSCENGLCTNSCKYVDKYSNCDEVVQSRGCKGSFARDCAATCNCPNAIK